MTLRYTFWLPAVLGLSLTTNAIAQDAPRPGRIVGYVRDEATGAPISGAQVGIAAGGQRVSAGLDGRYTILNVPAGPVALAVRAIGYAPKTVSGIDVPAGGVASLDVVLSSQAVELVEISVTAAVERGSVAQGLEEQRTATNIVNTVTAEQIARSPDGDAAQAMQRVSGVSVQDGKYVFVRGLGERYTTTSLNNARIPSAEPDRKVVPLDLFPAGLLEAVSTSKTFTPDQSGDFSGAQVNLRTREFDHGRVLTWSLSTGYNTAATGRSLQMAPRVRGDLLGLNGSARALPAPLAAIPGGLYGVSSSEIPPLISSFRDVWNAQNGTGPMNGSSSFSVGGEDPLLGHLFGYLASLTYSYGTDVRRNEQRALGVADGQGGARPINEFQGGSVTSSVLWGGIANLSTRLGSSTRLTFNNTYNRGGDNSAIRMAGFHEEFAHTFDVTRLQYVSRSVRSNQLAGEHLLARRHTIAWALTSSGVTRDEPDRSDLVNEARRDTTTGVVTPIQWFGGVSSGNRTFTAVRENGLQADASWRWALPGTTGAAVKFGGQFRTTDRTAETRSYDIVNQSLGTASLRLPAEQIFTLSDSLFLSANVLGGSYTAADRLSAGFAMLELPLSHRLRLIGGARVEHSDVRVKTVATNGMASLAAPVTTDLLPALSINADLGHNQQLRLAAAQTLSRPEYRELSDVCYFELLGGLTSCGNPALHRALIQNFDARWEWYPRGGEIVSVGLFAKRFDQPIERVLVATTGASTVGFVNTDGATNYGLEVELRKSLGMFGQAFLPFFAGINATVMRSQINVGNAGTTSLTNASRPMVGQSPYVVNASLGYISGTGRLAATVFYNIVGRRIVEAGTQPLPDSYEEARSVLDLSLRYSLWREVSLKVDARNLLDTPFHTTQAAVTRLRYTVGRTMAFGFTWAP
jgi:hypothetical protein